MQSDDEYEDLLRAIPLESVEMIYNQFDLPDPTRPIKAGKLWESRVRLSNEIVREKGTTQALSKHKTRVVVIMKLLKYETTFPDNFRNSFEGFYEKNKLSCPEIKMSKSNNLNCALLNVDNHEITSTHKDVKTAANCTRLKAIIRKVYDRLQNEEQAMSLPAEASLPHENAAINIPEEESQARVKKNYITRRMFFTLESVNCVIFAIFAILLILIMSKIIFK